MQDQLDGITEKVLQKGKAVSVNSLCLIH